MRTHLYNGDTHSRSCDGHMTSCISRAIPSTFSRIRSHTTALSTCHTHFHIRGWTDSEQRCTSRRHGNGARNQQHVSTVTGEKVVILLLILYYYYIYIVRTFVASKSTENGKPLVATYCAGCMVFWVSKNSFAHFYHSFFQFSLSLYLLPLPPSLPIAVFLLACLKKW